MSAGTNSRSSSASSSSLSSTPTSSLQHFTAPASTHSSSSLHHPLPPRPLPSPTPETPSFTLMTPTPPPSMTRPTATQSAMLSPLDDKPRKWRASPLTSVSNVHNARAHASPFSPTNSNESYSSSQAQNIPSTINTTTAFTNTTPNPLQTTNVYINGLPPHYKDEELYALTAPFGTVLSCRTFTRQLADRPSGYGFVLFETIDAAQQCINILRSHHNLHPHFAKGAHKIPGVAAASVPEPPTPGPADFTHMGNSKDDRDGSGDIYIEGLPMNIDAQTLRALLAPHAVHSSRFFADTRVQPPQLVALVRLQTRTAAQDVHEKLHGRTIRGYSARLAVSLADNDADVSAMFAGNLTHDHDPDEGHVISGLPAAAEYYDPFVESEFAFQSQQQSRGLGHGKNQNLNQNQSHGQVPQVDQLLHSLQNMALQPTPAPITAAVPAPLQPISATLHSLQLQLESLRPLLAAYTNPTPAPPAPSSSTFQRLRSHSQSANDTAYLSPFSPSTSSTSISSPTLNPNANLSIGGHSRAHTTGQYQSSGLGLGAPLFPHPQSLRHVSNPNPNLTLTSDHGGRG